MACQRPAGRGSEARHGHQETNSEGCHPQPQWLSAHQEGSMQLLQGSRPRTLCPHGALNHMGGFWSFRLFHDRRSAHFLDSHPSLRTGSPCDQECPRGIIENNHFALGVADHESPAQRVESSPGDWRNGVATAQIGDCRRRRRGGRGRESCCRCDCGGRGGIGAIRNGKVAQVTACGRIPHGNTMPSEGSNGMRAAVVDRSTETGEFLRMRRGLGLEAR
eukprot:scaffold825_cov30-Tisochrysis_lutea.AAC.5